MLRSTVLLLLSALPVAAGSYTALHSATATSSCVNAIVHEPLLVYEVHGGTLAGPVALNLIVFSDGSARWADLSDADVPRGGVVNSTPGAVLALVRDLEILGGGGSCDAQGYVTDVPLHTLTLLGPGTNSRAHTFSWWLPESSNGMIQLRVEQFLAEFVPQY